MYSRDFCYWLQGFFELASENASFPSGNLTLNRIQLEMIKSHLALVFKHEIDPEMGDSDHQEALNNIHKPTIGGTDADGNTMRC